MDDQVILFIGDQKFLLSMEEAMDISRILCGASRITTSWLGNGHENRNQTVIGEPDPKAATIAPMTGVMQLDIDANMKILAEKNKR
jgi:hypothetical protein